MFIVTVPGPERNAKNKEIEAVFRAYRQPGVSKLIQPSVSSGSASADYTNCGSKRGFLFLIFLILDEKQNFWQ